MNDAVDFVGENAACSRVGDDDGGGVDDAMNGSA